MQNKINILLETISKSSMNIKQKDLAFKMIGDIVLKYNLLDRDYKSRLKKDTKCKIDFIDYADRCQLILMILGVNSNDVEMFNFNYFSWVIENLGSVKKEFTFNSIKELLAYLQIFEMSYDRLPLDLTELKQSILSELNTSEEEFEQNLNESFKTLKIGQQVPEIVKFSWFKHLLKQK